MAPVSPHQQRLSRWQPRLLFSKLWQGNPTTPLPMWYQRRLKRKMGCWVVTGPPHQHRVSRNHVGSSFFFLFGWYQKGPTGGSGLVPVPLRPPLPMVSVEGMGATLGTPATASQKGISRALVGSWNSHSLPIGKEDPLLPAMQGWFNIQRSVNAF